MVGLPLVTVCTPTRGRPQLLKRALDSVARQSYSGPLACVVSENGLTDETTGIVVEARRKAPHISWILEQSPSVIPPVENWKRAIQRAEGTWVKILWDDDWMEQGFLDRTVSVALSEKVQVVTTAARVVTPGGESRVLYGETPEFAHQSVDTLLRRYTGLLPPLPVSPAATLVDRECALEALEVSRNLGGCFDRAMGPDLAMILEPALRQGGIAHVPEVLVNFWAGNDSISMMSSELDLRLCYDRTLIDLCQRHGAVLPQDVRRRLQHRAFLAWVRRHPDREHLLPPRPSLRRLVVNVWDRRRRRLDRN